MPNTPARGAEGTAADLQATASAADLSSPRRFDDKMLERFADAIVALEINPQLCMLVGLDVWG